MSEVLSDLQALNIDGENIDISNVVTKKKNKKVSFNNKSNDDEINIYGFVIPKSTMYLIIVLSAISLIIWYITYQYDVKGKKEDKK
jgi:hypothetical protein